MYGRGRNCVSRLFIYSVARKMREYERQHALCANVRWHAVRHCLIIEVSHVAGRKCDQKRCLYALGRLVHACRECMSYTEVPRKWDEYETAERDPLIGNTRKDWRDSAPRDFEACYPPAYCHKSPGVKTTAMPRDAGYCHEPWGALI